ncbi:MAG: mevalonate kinase [Labilithrix sp.]|nr:mevalonate kinase [Labilithrix sp.]MBX3224776.1 mevalonate kinase [Labilithrix sp.]
MTTTEGAARGKVILFGEHAVVYGVPAIAVGIERGARARAEAIATGPSTLRVRDWNMKVREDDPETPLARAFGDLLRVTREAGVSVSAVSVEAESDLPPGGGLGCSAALGVAVARALDPEASPEVIADRAGAWEAVFHGNASGVDAAVASLGGCVLFERGGPTERSTITRVRAPGVVHLCIGNSGEASSTRSMVEAVARLRARRPETTQKAFDAIHTLVKNARLAIEAADRNAVGQLLDLNQMLLSGLFVSTPEIEQMCSAARAAGALGAKLTGAGGGGCVVALVDHADAGAKVLAAWKSDGFDGFLTTFGAPETARRGPSFIESAP